jgi:hypothetical protein
MAARLKVFVTTDGLTDYVVAATSKLKALAAWGSRQDLFKTGLAHETDDPELVKAATAKPGEVLRRPADTAGKLAKLKPAKTAPPRPVKAQKPAGPSKAALKKVADLEKKLAAIDKERDQALRKIDQRRAALDREAEAVTSRFADERARYEAALAAARRALG